MKQKRRCAAMLALALCLSLTACAPLDEPRPEEALTEKPVIYLYPEQDEDVVCEEKPVAYCYPTEPTEVTVQLEYAGTLTCTYPAYKDGWTVFAQPDGTLTDASGQTYRYLYWEGQGEADYDFSTGFCVAGADTAAFLDDALAQLGLNRVEANEFIVYWLPRMQENAYNLISFQQEAYTDGAKLHISPQPDTLIRVFMAYQPLQEPIECTPQTLCAPQREGFVVVEWGGAEVTQTAR